MLHDGEEQKARHHYVVSAEAFWATVAQVLDVQWGLAALGDWTVLDLVGHASRALLTVETYLRPGDTVGQPEVTDACAYYGEALRALSDPEAVAERGRAAGRALGENPTAVLRTIIDRVLALVDGEPNDALVQTPVGSMTLAGYLPSRTFELVVHTLDLAAAIHVEPPVEIDGVTPGCLRLAADLASARGASRELLLTLTGRRMMDAEFSVV